MHPQSSIIVSGLLKGKVGVRVSGESLINSRNAVIILECPEDCRLQDWIPRRNYAGEV